MKLLSVAFVALMLSSAAALRAQAPPYVAPEPAYVWIATACSQWDCAMAAMAAAGGDGSAIALPTNHDKHPWLVLQRVVAGSVVVSPDEPYLVEAFTTPAVALARYSAIDAAHGPILLSRNGSCLVISLRAPKVRVVRR